MTGEHFAVWKFNKKIRMNTRVLIRNIDNRNFSSQINSLHIITKKKFDSLKLIAIYNKTNHIEQS